MMNPRYSFLALNALKFFRKIIGLKDEFYNRYIIKFDLISYVVDAFVKNGLKHNMLNSAVLELFEFIKSEDIKSLIKYISEKHIDPLLSVEQCTTFKALKTKYEQQVEREANKKTADGLNGPAAFDNIRTRFRRDARDLDENEENYFNDEESSDKQAYNSSPLVVQNKVIDTKPPPNKVINSEKHVTTPLEKVISPLEKVETTEKAIPTTPLEKVMSTSSPHLDKIAPSPLPSSPAVIPVSSPLVSASSSPLVDYDDDSNEEEELPLNKRQKVSSTVASEVT